MSSKAPRPRGDRAGLCILLLIPTLFVGAKIVDSPLVNPVPAEQWLIKAPRPRSILLAPYEPSPYEAAMVKCNATITPDVAGKLTHCGAIVMDVFKHQVPTPAQ